MSDYDILRQIVSKRTVRKSRSHLDIPIRRSGFMKPGRHKVAIIDVDTSLLKSQTIIRVTFASVEDMDCTHTARWFMMNRERDQLGVWILRLFHALFGFNTNTRDDFLALALSDPTKWQMLRGMRLWITIKPTPGHVIDYTGNGYTALNAETQEPVSPEFKTVEQARNHALAKGFKRSFNNIAEVYSDDSDHNVEALCNAIKDEKSAEGTEDSHNITRLR